MHKMPYVTIKRERTGVCERIAKRTRPCYWIARPAKPEQDTMAESATDLAHSLTNYRILVAKYSQ